MANQYIQKQVVWRRGENTLYAGTPVDENTRPANNETAIGIVAEDVNAPDRTATVLIAGTWDEYSHRERIALHPRAKRAMKDIQFVCPPKRLPEEFQRVSLVSNGSGRVSPAPGGGDLATGGIIETLGIPNYVSDVTEYSEYALTDPGWYVFARIQAADGVLVTANTTVTGAAGYVATIGENYVDVAVRFDVAAMSQAVVIDWGDTEETFVFKSTDLAVRNLDYRTTFYVYDIAPYATWEYALTTDATFVADTKYYTRSGDIYTLAEVTAGETVPADTYYVHSKLTFEGMARNVTYQFDEIVDCPQEYILPEIEDDGHGAWYEIRLRHAGSYSSTLVVPEGVKIATEHTQAETAGMNMVDLHYMSIDGIKIWRFMNTHSSIPT